ncbi:MAG: GTP pyrophosphokinase family protein [Bifidobacteriaceae bacterium]|nr:GTP pyrophosphokinase family protein [Bifidobacteriaceae bacterium]MCI1915376.1 GTP pyrophosphokinase family protein [Bifidobacteriaceae bacterium]
MLQQFDAQKSFETLSKFTALMQVYAGAMREISTKLENLDDEFQYRDLPNPIHHMESRLKSLESILGKLQRRGLPLELESVKNNIRDIAGIRVICNYIDDVYEVADMLSKQSDVNVLRVKDYIKNPKPNGYRSLHIIYTVPVFLSDGPHVTPVEVQFRTIAMDYWASLEHQLRYKNTLPDTDIAEHSKALLACAQQLSHVENSMQEIHRDISRHREAVDAVERIASASRAQRAREDIARVDTVSSENSKEETASATAEPPAGM